MLPILSLLKATDNGLQSLHVRKMMQTILQYIWQKCEQNKLSFCGRTKASYEFQRMSPYAYCDLHQLTGIK